MIDPTKGVHPCMAAYLLNRDEKHPIFFPNLDKFSGDAHEVVGLESSLSRWLRNGRTGVTGSIGFFLPRPCPAVVCLEKYC